MRHKIAQLLLVSMICGSAQAASAPPPSNEGSSALHWAAYQGDITAIRKLVASGVDVRTPNQFGETPMSIAATAGDGAAMRVLLDAGADVESRSADGQTALMLVSRGQHIDAATLLLDRGADPNAMETWRGQTALMWAAAQAQPEMVALLLQRGADANARSFINDNARQITAEPRAMYRPAAGLTPLLYAARQGCVECATSLVQGGALVDLEDPEGVTPLMVALSNAHFDLAAELVRLGAESDKWDWRGITPLYMAIDMNTLPRGGRPDRPSTDKLTGLDVARLLLEHGANPNVRLKLHPGYREVKDDRGADRMLTIGATPLLRAAKAFDVESLQLLLRHGADPEIATVNGTTPLMAAAGLGSRIGDTRGVYDTADVQQRAVSALRVLLEAGAALDRPASDGRTAVFGPVAWGWREVFSFLRDRGARMDVKDRKGATLADAASEHPNVRDLVAQALSADSQ